MLRVFNTTQICVIGDKVELADTSMRRLFGLLGRRGLETGGGLWIKPSSGVHTFFMSFGEFQGTQCSGVAMRHNLADEHTNGRPALYFNRYESSCIDRRSDLEEGL